MLYNIDALHNDGTGGCGAIRIGKWKLVVNGTCGFEQYVGQLDSRNKPPELIKTGSCSDHNTPPVAAGATFPNDTSTSIATTTTGVDVSRVELFDLELDSSELHDMSLEYPHIVSVLSQRLSYYRLRAVPDLQSIELGDSQSLPVLHEGEYGPWVDSLQTFD